MRAKELKVYRSDQVLKGTIQSIFMELDEVIFAMKYVRAQMSSSFRLAGH
jgi:hypothetical protein